MDLGKDVRVTALMTAPRYEAVYARNQIDRALNENGIPLCVSGGVFYGQCMQRMLSDAVEAGIDYAITVDFDSMFTGKHVKRLLSIVVQEEHIDALAALQPRRGTGEVLGSPKDPESTEMLWEGKPLEVRTAHFGLTVLDLNKLKNVPKPWFHASPDAEGDWGDDKIDDDVSFWMAWEKAGNSVYLDPGCRLGHLQELISIFDENMQVKHLMTGEWEDSSEDSVD